MLAEKGRGEICRKELSQAMFKQNWVRVRSVMGTECRGPEAGTSLAGVRTCGALQ